MRGPATSWPSACKMASKPACSTAAAPPPSPTNVPLLYGLVSISIFMDSPPRRERRRRLNHLQNARPAWGPGHVAALVLALPERTAAALSCPIRRAHARKRDGDHAVPHRAVGRLLTMTFYIVGAQRAQPPSSWGLRYRPLIA